jgi:hypothetical protein
MPFLLEQRLVLFDDTLDFDDLIVSKTVGMRQRYGIEPKFSVTFSALNVNMRRFLSFQAEKEKPFPSVS